MKTDPSIPENDVNLSGLGRALLGTNEGSKPSGPWIPPTAEELHAILPQYEIVKMLGRGGMGAVYMGRQTALDRPVAIKILSAQLEESDMGFTERFKNEARAMGKLNHPSIVSVYEFGQHESGLLYIVMEYVDGTDVAKMIAKSGRLHTEHAMAITAHVCDALAYAHERGIIHRDIKPANIMVDYDGSVKIADFGLAKVNAGGQTLGLTQSGMAMGTLHFMAPEALMLGTAVDHRADIYAVGVMLYQMLTGKLPQGVFSMPSLQVPGLDPRYDTIIAKAMMVDREARYQSARYQSARELRSDLDGILTQPVAQVESDVTKAPAALPTQARPQRSGGSSTSRSRPTPAVMESAPSAVAGRKVGLHQVTVLWGSVILFGVVLFGGLAWLTRQASEPEAAQVLPPDDQADQLPAKSALPEGGSSAAPMAAGTAKSAPASMPVHAAVPAVSKSPPSANSLRAASNNFNAGQIGDTRVVDLGSGVKLTLCYCPPGSFTMGSPPSEAGRGNDEDPVSVRITQGFWLGQYEVTQAQWVAVMGRNPSHFKGDALPVEQVSWEDAQAFIGKLNQTAALPVDWKYALPTEAQWEYACRAGTEGPYAGTGQLEEMGWYDGNSGAKTHSVGAKRANAWGLHDMHGNIWEWCADWYGAKLAGGTDPAGAPSGSERVYRGGSWYRYAEVCRAAFRSKNTPGLRSRYLGFRLAAVPAGAR